MWDLIVSSLGAAAKDQIRLMIPDRLIIRLPLVTSNSSKAYSFGVSDTGVSS